MRHFTTMSVGDAIRWAAAGGQALHTHPALGVHSGSPAPFVRAGERGEDIAHLFDWNSNRLYRTAVGFGIRRVYVDKQDTIRQHVDLCARPLRVAMTCAVSESDFDPPAARLRKMSILYAMAFCRRPSYEAIPAGPGVIVGPREKAGSKRWAWRSALSSAAQDAIPEPLFGQMMAFKFGRVSAIAAWPERPPAVYFRTRKDAVAGLGEAFVRAGVDAAEKCAGDVAEAGVAERFRLMTVGDFRAVAEERFHKPVTDQYCRFVFGSDTGDLKRDGESDGAEAGGCGERPVGDDGGRQATTV